MNYSTRLLLNALTIASMLWFCGQAWDYVQAAKGDESGGTNGHLVRHKVGVVNNSSGSDEWADSRAAHNNLARIDVDHSRSRKHGTTGFFSDFAGTNGAFAISSAGPTIHLKAAIPVGPLQHAMPNRSDEASTGETGSLRHSIRRDDGRAVMQGLPEGESYMESTRVGDFGDGGLLVEQKRGLSLTDYSRFSRAGGLLRSAEENGIFGRSHEGNSELEESYMFWWVTNSGREVWVPSSFYYDALKVVACETRGDPWNPYAVGALLERGWFQIHPIHRGRFERRGWSWAEAFDPGKNTEIALEIWTEQGWQPWGCRP